MAILGLTGNIGVGKDTVAKMIQYYFCKNYNEVDEDITIVKFLEEYENYNKELHKQYSTWEIKKFAYKLKQICALLIGCNAEDFESEEFKNSFLPDSFQSIDALVKYSSGTNNRKTNRWLLQKVGTESIRNVIGKDTWINALFADYKEKCEIGKIKEEEIINKETIDNYTKFPNWIISDCRFLNEAKSIKDRLGIIIKISRYENEINSKDLHISETELNHIKYDYVILNNGTIEELYTEVEKVMKCIFPTI